MALQTQTRDYEVLVRIKENGSAASHYQQLRTITEDGVVISETVLPPVEMPISDLKAFVSNL